MFTVSTTERDDAAMASPSCQTFWPRKLTVMFLRCRRSRKRKQFMNAVLPNPSTSILPCTYCSDCARRQPQLALLPHCRRQRTPNHCLTKLFSEDRKLHWQVSLLTEAANNSLHLQVSAVFTTKMYPLLYLYMFYNYISLFIYFIMYSLFWNSFYGRPIK